MAIFTGTWKDASGVPFDASAQVLHDQPGGGYVGAKRNRRSRCNQRETHPRIIGYLKDRWHNVLTPHQRSLWEQVLPASPIARGKYIGKLANGWIGFCAACYAEVWRFGNTVVTEPKYFYAFNLIFWISHVNVNDQTFEWNLTYPAAFGGDPYAFACIYQMKPTKAKIPTCWRDTRMIAVNSVWDPAGNTFTQTVHAKFRLIWRRTTRVFARFRYGWGWDYWDTDISPIPYP
jgi:hypothetical protein